MDRCHYGVQGHSSCFASTSAKEPRTAATVLNESAWEGERERKKERKSEMAGRRGREGAFTTSGLDFFFFSLLLSRCLPLHFFPSSVDVPPLCICKAPHVVRFPDCSSAYPPFPRHIFLAMGARDLGTLRTNTLRSLTLVLWFVDDKVSACQVFRFSFRILFVASLLLLWNIIASLIP